MRWISPCCLHPAIRLLLLATGLSLAACNSGGTALRPGPPAPMRVLNDRIWACDNKPLTFEVVPADEFVSTYTWTFDDGVTPLISTNSVARVRTTRSGAFQGSVITRNAYGTSEPIEFSFAVVDCPDVTLQVVDESISPRGQFLIEYQITGDAKPPIREVDEPAFDLTGLANLPFRVSRAGEGEITGRVFAHSPIATWAVGDIAEFQATLRYPGPAPLWERIMRVEGVDDTGPAQLSLRDGHPILTFVDHTTSDLVYMEAQVPVPTANQWNTHHVYKTKIPTVARAYFSPGAGHPVLYIQDSPQTIWVSRVAHPLSPSDWLLPITRPSTAPINADVAVLPDGRFVSLSGIGDGLGLRIQTTLQPEPQTTDDLLETTIGVNGLPLEHASQCMIWKGRPILLVRDPKRRRTFIGAALDATIRSDADVAWYEMTAADQSAALMNEVGLCAGTSRLWLEVDQPIANRHSLHFVTAADSPQSESDWEFLGEFSGIGARDGELLGAEIDGRLVSAYPDSRQDAIRIMRALVPLPGQARDWQGVFATNQIPNVGGSLFFTSQMAVKGNRIYILYDTLEGGDAYEVQTATLDW